MADEETVPVARPKIVKIASKSPSSASWSPEQLLEEFLADIRAGKIHPTNLLVFWMDDDGKADGHLLPRRWIANVSRTEEIAFYALGTIKAVEDWRS